MRQGCILSPLLFNMILDECIKQNRHNLKPHTIRCWKLRYVGLTELKYADENRKNSFKRILISLLNTEGTLQDEINERVAKTTSIKPTFWVKKKYQTEYKQIS